MDSIDSLVRDVIRDETSQYITKDDLSSYVTDDYLSEIADDLSDKLTELQTRVEILESKFEKQNQAIELLFTQVSQVSQVAQVKPNIFQQMWAWVLNLHK
jgi:tRNA(Phe) wybutosine-synthesizing methylase Tyw3